MLKQKRKHGSMHFHNSINRCLFLSILLTFSSSVCAMGCGESRLYTDQTNEIIDQIQTILISERLCDNKNDCNKKQYILFQPSSDIEISVYGITDPMIVKKIVNVYIEAHAKNPGITHKLYVYRQTKYEDVKSFSTKKTILQLTLNKEE